MTIRQTAALGGVLVALAVTLAGCGGSSRGGQTPTVATHTDTSEGAAATTTKHTETTETATHTETTEGAATTETHTETTETNK